MDAQPLPPQLLKLHYRVPLRLVRHQPIRSMPLRDHQAVPRRHRKAIGDAQQQFVLQQHPAAALQPAEHTARLAQGVTGVKATEVGATPCVGKQPSRLPALPRRQTACGLLRSSEPPRFLGTMGCTSRARWCGVCQATGCAAAFAAAPVASVNPVLDRAAGGPASAVSGYSETTLAFHSWSKPVGAQPLQAGLS